MPTNDARTIEIHRFIEAYVARKNRPPSYRQIAAAVDCGLTTVAHHVHKLEKDGKLTIEPGARGIVLVAREPSAPPPPSN